MKTYPLSSMSLNEAKKLQFKIVDCITRNFEGNQILTRGDLGVVMPYNKTLTTIRVEKTIADIFNVESAVLVRGAGTGAIRTGLFSLINSSETILVHDAPIYPTTAVIVKSMGLKVIKADFNNTEDLKKVILENHIDGALVQHTRQKIEDGYNFDEVIKTIKNTNNDIKVLTDDNYAVMKVKKIGVECGADLSAFSCFKLLGPEGVGCVVGKKEYVDKIIESNYSGGCQVQGHEAIDVLRGLVYAPVSLAIQAEVNDEVINRLNSGELSEIKNAFLANAQSKVILVELKENIAYEVLKEAQKLGAAPNPVGAESKYEMVPMFYRISGTFRKADPKLEFRMVRINPMRSGADTIINILDQSIKNVINKR